ncbi:hypothetical protein Zmor_027621 [Zophobas morio]|uniref:Uncharacterized protein n=1 Tax=Zophobas morio TaxID=2755281 RepID=A0AA38HNY9_9CUCU|nr:hypothetical protein Zmor_027621 [Zophobas morio]
MDTDGINTNCGAGAATLDDVTELWGCCPVEMCVVTLRLIASVCFSLHLVEHEMSCRGLTGEGAGGSWRAIKGPGRLKITGNKGKSMNDAGE